MEYKAEMEEKNEQNEQNGGVGAYGGTAHRRIDYCGMFEI